jgi:hypothetical protein
VDNLNPSLSKEQPRRAPEMGFWYGDVCERQVGPEIGMGTL